MELFIYNKSQGKKNGGLEFECCVTMTTIYSQSAEDW